ncbi:MAG: S8 family serine peptidase [Rhodobacteraceae bacterium]|nr:S8 family serine peptidase [Paracoccaceae bacterium]
MRRALPQPPRRRSTALMLSLSSLALLSACGGGGEEEIDLASYLPDFQAPIFSDASFLANAFTAANGVTAEDVDALLDEPNYVDTAAGLQWIRTIPGFQDLSGTNEPLRSSGAAFAHAAGLTGAGQFIAITDEHITPEHASLNGRVSISSNPDSGDEHGTSVASVAVGNSPDFVGVAPGAQVLFGTYEDPTNQSMTDLGNTATDFGAVAWNNSWLFLDLYANQTDFDVIFASPDGQQYLNALRNYANFGVVVFAASNDENQQNAGLMDALPVLQNDLEAGWIAAINGVPTLVNGDVQSVTLLSSACWQAARWCLVADGSWNAAVGSGSDLEETTGTSFAAPQISGAMALLAEAFSNTTIAPDDRLSPHELRIRLLASADADFAGFNADGTVTLANGFDKPYSVIYGHGFMDIEAALKPIGGVAMATAMGESLAVDAPILLTGSGLGDAVEVSLAATNLAVKDALSAGFVMPGTALTAGARPGSQAGALLAKSLRSNLTAERIASPAALDDPFAAFTGPVLELSAPDGTASAAVLMPQGDGALGFTLTRALTDGPTKVEIGLKLARDNGGLLSLGGEEGAAMASVALGVTQDLGNGAFMALSGEMGLTDLGGDTALGDSSSARFDAVKLTAGQSDLFTKGDRLSVGVGMPIAIASGETVLYLPVSRAGLAAGFEAVALDLAPENRQLDLEVTYQTALADGVEMQLSLIHSDNFGNRAGETDTAGALAFALRF